MNYDATGTTADKAAYTDNYGSVLLDYSLSKRSDVYAGLMKETTGQAGYNKQNLIAVGMRQKF